MATKKKLTSKAKYVPNRMINEIEVERNGRTTTIDGADLLDGAYVKRTVKFGNGGGTAVSSQSGLAEGTNADLLMNQNNLQYGNGGGVAVSSSYGYTMGTNADEWQNQYEQGGRMGTWCYEIGGL
jgi:hypothetical protein